MSTRKTNETYSSDDEDECIDLRDDRNYQILSAVLETEKGNNVADILTGISKDMSGIRKDIHSMAKEIKLLSRSVHQLIQFSLMSRENLQDNSDDSS